MKRLRRWIQTAAVLLGLLLYASIPCLAAAPEPEGMEALRELPPGAAEALEGISPVQADPEQGLAAVGDMLRNRFDAALAEALRPAAAVTAAALFCSLLSPLNLREAGRFDYIELSGCLAVAAASAGDIAHVLTVGGETVEELADYGGTLLPLLTAVSAASGAVSSAGAKYAAAALFSQLLVTASRELILPLICAFAAVSAAGAALGTGQLAGAAKLLRWCVSKTLLGLVLVFTAYLGFAGVLTTAADAAAVRAARAALSTALPIVGRALSEVSSSLVAGAELLRASVGVFGMLAVLATAALPALRLGLRYLALQLAAAAVSAFPLGRLAGLIDALGSVYGMLLGLVGTAGVLHFFAIVSLLRSVTSA